MSFFIFCLLFFFYLFFFFFLFLFLFFFFSFFLFFFFQLGDKLDKSGFHLVYEIAAMTKKFSWAKTNAPFVYNYIGY